ncbi:uncharacterized protein LOC126736501 [Anthonomus grandis grandis]|uniref:uncharacterized protein LOC126736501 n=1 Tax=Anthonomus grandis grandis TaxID=2921223 RepID=UPI002165A8F9|nr:uncharacterized protein LOC126736501 [Anthonomus grandis grandis]
MTIARDKCQQGLYKISEPSIVTLSMCPVEIDNKTYEGERKTEFQYVLELPKFSYVQSSNNNSKLTLEEINLDELKTAQKILSTIQLHPLEAPENSTYPWIAPISSIAALICGILLYIGWKKWKKPVSSHRSHHYENDHFDGPSQESRKKRAAIAALIFRT